MILFEPFKPSGFQVAQRQLSEARRKALQHTAAAEVASAEAERQTASARMFQDRIRRLESELADAQFKSQLEGAAS